MFILVGLAWLICGVLAAGITNAYFQGTAARIRELVREREALKEEIAQWKKCYDLRGKALARPCIACGHVPAIIRAALAATGDKHG